MGCQRPLRLDSAERLILLRQEDRDREWESLDDRRFCTGCGKLISGRQINLERNGVAQVRLSCPTENCESRISEWLYPSEAAHAWPKLRSAGKKRALNFQQRRLPRFAHLLRAASAS